MPFLSGLLKHSLFNENTYLVFTIGTTVFMLFTGMYLTRMFINYQIVSLRSQFPAIFFISVSAFAFFNELFSGAVISGIFLLFALERILGSVDLRQRTYRFFDAGMLLGMASLFYFNIIFLLPFFLIAQVILKPQSWRSSVYVCIGVSLPFLYIFAVYFMKGNSLAEVTGQIKEWVVLRKIVNLGPYIWGGLGLYLLVVLISSFYALQIFAKTKIILRKYFQLLFILFLNLLLILLIIPSAGYEIFYFIAMPASVPLSIYFSECRNNLFNKALFFLILIMPLMINFI